MADTGIKSSYQRASDAKVRGSESSYKSKTIKHDRDLDIKDEEKRIKRFTNFMDETLKIVGFGKDVIAAQKREANIKVGEKIYNQLNPDNQITPTKVTFKNYKDLGKTIFDVTKTHRINKDGIEFTGGDLDAIRNYVQRDKKYGAIVESLGGDLRDLDIYNTEEEGKG
tara:strand:- start:1486 stop:1989 length:504 start_codon:yes stop_codon:yes gene_type:complete